MSKAQALRDIKNAFDNWKIWAGNEQGDDIADYEEMVEAARKRVVDFIKQSKLTY